MFVFLSDVWLDDIKVHIQYAVMFSCYFRILVVVLKKVKKRIAVSGIPSHSYGTSLAIWDHTVLPATRHK